MGEPKQLLPYRGVPLLQHVIDLVEAAGLEEIVVVLGHSAAEIEAAVRLPSNARIVVNPAYESGQASSLRLGLESASPESRAAMIFLGDQPDVAIEAIEAVLRVYASSGGPVVRAEYRGTPGHPVLLDRSVWEEAASEPGDRGAAPVLARHPEWIVSTPLDLPVPSEVDTPEDFRALAGEEIRDPDPPDLRPPG